MSSYGSYDFFQTEILGTINEINSTNTQYKYRTINNTLNWFYAINNNLNFQTKLISSDYSPTTLLPELNSDNKVKIKSGITYKQIKTNLNYFKGKHKLEVGLDAINYLINPGELDPGTNQNITSVFTQHENAYELGAYVQDEIEVSDKFVITAGLRYSHFLNMGPGSYRTYQAGMPREEISLLDTMYVNKGQVQKVLWWF